MADYTIEALAAEINNDPIGIGYKVNGVWKGDQEIADLLNSRTPGYTVNRTVVKSSDIRSLTTFEAFDGLTVAEENWLRWLTSGEEVAVTSDTLMNLAGVGGDSKWATADEPTMEPRMQALMQFTGSRAEALWGEGFQVGPGMVGAAANV